MNKRKTLKSLLLAIMLASLLPLSTRAQSKLGISDVSVAFTDVKHGLPFSMITPIHPGIELGTTYFRKDKENSTHSFDAKLGGYHHPIIANGVYLNTGYNYQLRLKNTIGVDFRSGLGLQYSQYPSDGYAFDETSKSYEQVSNSKIYMLINLGLGLSYTRHDRIQPFIHYDFNVHNIWSYMSFANSNAILKAGVKINL